MLPLAPLFGFAETLIDRLVPDRAEAERLKSEIEAKVQLAEIDLAKAQQAVAAEDAKSGVGGYRWGAGWLCVIALGYAWLLEPLLVWALSVWAPHVPPPPAMGTEMQWTMLTGMLGLAGVRSFDLKSGSRK